MADFDALATELTTDPEDPPRGYSGMDDQAAADDLNIVRIDQIRESISGFELFDAIVDSEFVALTEQFQDQILMFGQSASIDARDGSFTADLIVRIFGAPSTTVANLIDVRNDTVSKGSTMGFSFVEPGHVEHARAL